MNDNRCVCCGRIIPEGRQGCPVCEEKAKRWDIVEYWVDSWIVPLTLFGLLIFAVVRIMSV